LNLSLDALKLVEENEELLRRVKQLEKIIDDQEWDKVCLKDEKDETEVKLVE